MTDAVVQRAQRLSPAFVPVAVLVGAVTLALSAWWLAADALRTRPARAAGIGVVRSELWLRDGWSELPASPEAAEAAFTRALRLSPMDAGAWFGLASATGRFDWLNPTASRALKMSYYTGFNRSDLIAPRLILLAQVDTARDVELVDLLRRQIRLILSRAPELKGAIGQAYRVAGDANRHIIEQEFKDAGQDIPH
ncbi:MULTISPECIES: hypothetical protein [Bradyrhizobium]|jgi:hypothetical protein|uniref:hypothetical protein n=1 Tax=Bradyrhizobium TaxID=374 RepID=UPI0003F4BC07|nr:MULTISPECIES: hypothetical protein [Bradyrhizobium]KIU45295.1 hypothetical protein QU41_25330 [Bradyrhizobium elkanii]MBK5654753.1 hypothetical protein [Rhizobium sp.]OCX30168.1 hypothetical protein QU42_14130 [Bradyrhizobium sp. UASWS1016]